MSLQSLDRTQWSFAEALAHVQNVTVARRSAESAKAPRKPEPACQHWNRPQDPIAAGEAAAGEAAGRPLSRGGSTGWRWPRAWP